MGDLASFASVGKSSNTTIINTLILSKYNIKKKNYQQYYYYPIYGIFYDSNFTFITMIFNQINMIFNIHILNSF